MELTISLTDVITITALATIVAGFITWMFKLWKEFNNLKASMAYRQDDMVMMFRCLRILLETTLDIDGGEKEALSDTLEDLNRYMEARTAGLNTRNKP
jgi:hypothetical protein